MLKPFSLTKRRVRFIILVVIILWLLLVIHFYRPKKLWKDYFFHKTHPRLTNRERNSFLENIMNSNIVKNEKAEEYLNDKVNTSLIETVKDTPEQKGHTDFYVKEFLLPTNQKRKRMKGASHIQKSSLIKFKGPQNAKQRRIVDAFMHAWNAYKRYAWGYDELQPLSKTGHQWMGVGMTIVDSLDTMYIMNLEKEFKLSRDWVRDVLSTNQNYQMQFFEVVIRLLGGLLSAFHLSGDKVFLDKAEEFGKAFKPCLQSSNHLPCNKIVTSISEPLFSSTNLAEVGSIQLEFRDLSRSCGDPFYEKMSFSTNEHLKNSKVKLDGLLPYMLNSYEDSDPGPISMGAMADSYYEYLLKQWLQTGKSIDWLKVHFTEAHKGALKHLIKKSKQANLTYIGIVPTMSYPSNFEQKMEHLACFYPGLLALAHIHGITNVDTPSVLGGATGEALIKTAADLTETCYEMYHQMPTGLSPESVYFDSGEPMLVGFVRENATDKRPKFSVDPSQTYNIHRPETVESLFYMYKATKDDKYRQWAWQIFEAFEHSTRLEEGYAGVKNVGATTKEEVFYMDKMETFYLAETLKYLYLMFDEGPDPLPLDKWVYNTEAHPLPIYPH